MLFWIMAIDLYYRKGGSEGCRQGISPVGRCTKFLKENLAKLELKPVGRWRKPRQWVAVRGEKPEGRRTTPKATTSAVGRCHFLAAHRV